MRSVLISYKWFVNLCRADIVRLYVKIKQSYSIASDISGIFNSHKGAFRREM
jgi:hypothetical protein